MRVLGVIALAAMVAAGCGGSGSTDVDEGPPPALPPVVAATVLLEDNFDRENGGQGSLNWSGFVNWTVASGCVDLHGNGFHDVQPGSGLYVDLDGTCRAGGTLESKTSFTLEPGDYVLEFGLAGNNRVAEPDTVVVSLGALFQEQLVVQRSSRFAQHARDVRVSTATTARIRFVHAGGDDQGIVLDLVRLRRKQ
jgi:hypothetical protein